MTDARRIFFVVSPSPRSGSTFLLKCITSHPWCEGKPYYENYVVSKMLDTLNWLADNEIMHRHFLLDHPANNLENVRAFVLKAMVNESPLMGMKFTHFRNFKFLRLIFPEAKIVVIQRDPRDTYCSFLDLQKKLGERRISAEEWFQKYIVSFYRSLGPEAHAMHFLNYENLVRGFDAEMSAVWRHLDVPEHRVEREPLLEVFKERHFSMEPQNFDERGVCSSRIGRHLSELAPAEVRALRANMRDLRRSSLYDREGLYGEL